MPSVQIVLNLGFNHDENILHCLFGLNHKCYKPQQHCNSLTVSSTFLPNRNPLCTHKVLTAMVETNTSIGILLNRQRLWVKNSSVILNQGTNSTSSPNVCLKFAMKLNMIQILHPLFTLVYRLCFTTPSNKSSILWFRT